MSIELYFVLLASMDIAFTAFMYVVSVKTKKKDNVWTKENV
jgi:hypothetical protein